MIDTHQKKQENSGSSMNPVIAGVAGIVAGGMAVAAAVAMSDKKNQKKVKEVVTIVKDKALEAKEKVQAAI